MDLIIKPTQACNFKCAFCSSNNIAESCQETLPLDTLFDFLKKHDVFRIIVNGGDPLMMSPDYYWNMLKFIEDNDMNTRLSLTTNLWDFYLHPDKWKGLFCQPNVGVCTSFQYGGERRLANGEEFTEEKFRKVLAMFTENIGYVPMFIAVINKHNEDSVLDTVRLAKSVGTKCKINPAVQSGRSKDFYPLYKMYEHYLNIIDAGLGDYEENCRYIQQVMHSQKTCCPYARTCYKNIRCISPDGKLHSCGCFNDDHQVNEAAGERTYELHEYGEKQIRKDYGYLKAECFGCSCFTLCNGCYKHIADIKRSGTIGEHCRAMHAIKGRLEKL